MFNRKITSESFDDSLEDFEDPLHDPLLTRDLLNKSITNDTSSVDLDTGEILRPQSQESITNARKRTAPPPKIAPSTQAKGNEIFKSPILFLLPIGTSLILSVITCLIGYFFYTNTVTTLSLQIQQSTEKLTNLNNLVIDLQTTIATLEDSDEVLGQLESLSIGLEDVEGALQNHLQISKHSSQLPVIKKSSPLDSLKTVAYLGFYGNYAQPVAIISIKDEKKELQTGQVIIDSWQINAIHPTHITVAHTGGMTQNISRKKSLF